MRTDMTYFSDENLFVFLTALCDFSRNSDAAVFV